MNFYKHHIGDYAQATAHLSFVEDAAYSRMIRKYYAEEKPLPADIKAIQRLIGARTREEKQAVEDVLQEFFIQAADGWHNKRCDAEIERANAQAETNRRIAEEREAKRRARMPDENSTNRPNSQNESSNESLHESSASREPSQTPDSRLQTPDLKAESTPLPAKPAKFDPASIPIPDGLALTKWGEWIAYRRGRRLTTAEPTMRKQLEFLTQCQARGQPADAVIEASIANGWQGLFELKGAGNGKNGSSRAERVSATIAELTGANRDPSRVIDGTAARVD